MFSRLLIVTDAWYPQINGVVTTIQNTIKELEKLNFLVTVIYPDKNKFLSISIPTYNEIKLTLNPWKIEDQIKSKNYEYIHIATEGPLGYFAAKYCKKYNIPYSSSYHTKFPEYVNKRFPWISTNVVYNYLKKIHGNAKNTLVTTESMKQELHLNGFKNLVIWGRGVDKELFNSSYRDKRSSKPILTYVGRVSMEKNLEVFLNLHLHFDHIKRIVGDGPLLEKYKKKYPNVQFIGYKSGKDLAYEYANADVFIFPSLTDTFGLVMIEAMSCGTPVVAFDIPVNNDIIYHEKTGYLITPFNKTKFNHFEFYIDKALKLNRFDVEMYASKFDWKYCTEIFIDSLVEV